MKKWILLFVLALTLMGCQPFYITKDQVSSIRPGINAKQVSTLLTKEKPSKAVTVTVKDVDYLIHFYDMHVGSRQEMTMSCGKYGCTPIMYTVPVTEDYAFVFRNQSLITWGFMKELAASPKRNIREIGRQARLALEEERKKAIVIPQDEDDEFL